MSFPSCMFMSSLIGWIVHPVIPLIGWIGYLRGVGSYRIISGYVSTRTSCYSCFGSAICGVSDHIGIYSYILFIPSGSSSLELGLRWVLTCLLCDRSKCAASVLRNWRYVTGPYQDSPFYETVDSTVCLASSWLSVHNSWYSWGFLMSLVFGNCYIVSWLNWYLVIPFWAKFLFGHIILGQIVWPYHFG